jgi:hypothetical protein
MGYVGTAPLSGDYRKLDDISSSFNASTTAFTLQVGSVNVTPPKATTVLISVGGILQEPVTAYDISGSTITFTAAPAAGADFFGVMLGAGVDIGTPGDDTVTLAKMAPGTDGNIISYDASGNPVAVATGTDGQVLTSAGAGAPPAFEDAAAGITEADQWRLTTNFVGNSDPIASNLERNDTAGFGRIGTGMTESSGIFTFPSTGIWQITFVVFSWSNSQGAWSEVAATIETTQNNSTYIVAGTNSNQIAGNSFKQSSMQQYTFDVVATATHKVMFAINSGDNITVVGNTSNNYTYMSFVRLGDT